MLSTTTTAETASAVATAEKPFKMNTYIQLEIDQSNFNCLPRVCKFSVTKLNINTMSTTTTTTTTTTVASGDEQQQQQQQQQLQQQPTSALILAVKLQGSKRSFRTIEIPMYKTTHESSPSSTTLTATNKSTPATTSSISSIDLNLNYNITYPHFIKKDTNILYFYIQRKKKYKTKTILGNYSDS
jgi:hypothetical protein